MLRGAAPGLDTSTAGGGPLSSFCNKHGNARAETPHSASEWANKVKAGGAYPGPPFQSSERPTGPPDESVPGLVDQRPLLDPGHHLAELGANLLDRVLGELGAGRLERGLVDLVLQHP